MSENYPIITIVIATFNSSKTLPIVLKSIKKQNYPQNRIEVLAVDGGSSDNTLELIEEFGGYVIDNPKTEPIHAKYLGFLNAKGKYIIYLDHDEEIENENSFKLKLNIFQKNKNIRSVDTSGYKNPLGYSFINEYINEYGDPFSFFVYRQSRAEKYHLNDLKKHYSTLYEDLECAIFSFSPNDVPLIENVAGGIMTDMEYVKSNLNVATPQMLVHLFHLLNEKQALLAVAKNDPLIHYSSDNLLNYFNKIKWRIKNNIHHIKVTGEAGFSGRERFQHPWLKIKKYLFIPYTYSIILPLIDSLYLAITRRKILYFIHLPLCLYTASLILYHYGLKIIGYKPKLKSYDESKIIEDIDN